MQRFCQLWAVISLTAVAHVHARPPWFHPWVLHWSAVFSIDRGKQSSPQNTIVHSDALFGRLSSCGPVANLHKLSRPHWIYFIRCTLCCAGCVCLPSGTETSCLRAHSRLGEPHGCRLAGKQFRGSRSGWLWLAGAAHSRASQKSPLGNLSGPHDGPGHQQMVSWKHVSVVVIQKGSTNVVHLFQQRHPRASD